VSRRGEREVERRILRQIYSRGARRSHFNNFVEVKGTLRGGRVDLSCIVSVFGGIGRSARVFEYTLGLRDAAPRSHARDIG
jgi:hypothetical protein